MNTVLANWVNDARDRSLRLVEDLTDDQLIGPQLEIVNPPLWELGHAVWFQEKWVLRHAMACEPLRENVDTVYDSIAIPHETRWDLPLFSRDEMLAYAEEVRDRVVEVIDQADDTRLDYFVMLSVFHEDMHTEAFTYTRQTLAYPQPTFVSTAQRDSQQAANERVNGEDLLASGGHFQLGAFADDHFVFDNEKWAHSVDILPFAIAKEAVTQSAFASFVDDNGYGRRDLWSEAGWNWREEVGARHPVYWRRETNGSWCRRDFDQWRPLEPDRPVIHVNYYEAEAFCRWAGRRLPTEAEWELAAAVDQTSGDGKRRFPWGDDEPTPQTANLDWHAGGTVDVAELSRGDSALGCRQMMGNVWEWTASDFQPYPGFTPDPYKEYSEPCFGSRKVLRGGCWATRSRLLRNTWRNYYTPDRRDVFAGFRTCALES